MIKQRIHLSLPIKVESQAKVNGDLINWRASEYYRIENYDLLEPFLISLMTDCDLWMYLSSSTGLTAGRQDSDHAIFPYETEDKLHVSHCHTGPVTIVRCHSDSDVLIWEPFSEKGRLQYQITRNIYKHALGNEVWFEEVNHSLGLLFRFGWRPSQKFGWIRTAELSNIQSRARKLSVLDGLRNILPAGIEKGLQDTMSCLVDAYKYAECDRDGIAIFGLTSKVVDRPEPSESLYVTVAWQTGLSGCNVILDSLLIGKFVMGETLRHQTILRGRRASYLLVTDFDLSPNEERTWNLAIDTLVDHSKLVWLRKVLHQRGDPTKLVEEAVEQSRVNLKRLLAYADAFQATHDKMACSHHIANVLYNIGRGGVPSNQYEIDREDLIGFIGARNKAILAKYRTWFESMERCLSLHELRDLARKQGDPNLRRLCDEYLPLIFSRRHGDPSRPWNRFKIVTTLPDGKPYHHYEGNWRDIFQNWEALCHSFPSLLESVIAKFLNASTVDGFNPYRVSRDGIEWEIPDKHNPWSSIGYWGDHQIVYLSKLLEAFEAHYPAKLAGMLGEARFSYADVPYEIKPYQEIVANPKDTIVFNWDRHDRILARVEALGTDGKLLQANGETLHVNLAEKLLVPLLAKISCLIPGGGIWMNTMRPEWNDANNALAGYGLSVVTACHLFRHIGLCLRIFEQARPSQFMISEAVIAWFKDVKAILDDSNPRDTRGAARRRLVDQLGSAFSNYREQVYRKGLGGRGWLSSSQICDFLRLTKQLLATTLIQNRRSDGLFHSYNILHLEGRSLRISRLPLMLEGQVAILSSGLLTPNQSLELLRRLRSSDLYRHDQKSYMLYPIRKLKSFLDKNRFPKAFLSKCPGLARLIGEGDQRILIQDVEGCLHFNPQIENTQSLVNRCRGILPDDEVKVLVDAYESIFSHRRFTGRSGAMFGYEGIGCIYWHMVGKLLVAIQDVLLAGFDMNAPRRVIKGLVDQYYQVRSGMGFNKQPQEFGAFPLDPYSHTPLSGGARQPGLSGQVKEEILTRWIELGIRVKEGRIEFIPLLLRRCEFLDVERCFEYIDVDDVCQSIMLAKGSLAFTYCQVPIVYKVGRRSWLRVEFRNGSKKQYSGHSLNGRLSAEIFGRTGSIKLISVSFQEGDLA